MPGRSAGLAPMPRLPRAGRIRGFVPRSGGSGLGQAQAGSTELPTPPTYWTGTPAEWVVNSWLTKNDLPFLYRDIATPLLPGQTAQASSSHPAFVVQDRIPGLVIEVQQEAGYDTGAERQGNAVRRSMLVSAGYQVVGVLARDVQGDADGTLRAALDGVQLFTSMWG